VAEGSRAGREAAIPPAVLTTGQILAQLTETPRRLAALAGGATPDRLAAAPAPGEWSPRHVLAHLHSCADVRGSAIARILAEEQPVIQAIDPRAWTERTDYRDLDFDTSLRAYMAQRAALLAVLEALPADDWQSQATVRGAGTPLVRTVHSFAGRLAIHERPHLNQIARASAAPIARP
jgi:hypothetical protein